MSQVLELCGDRPTGFGKGQALCPVAGQSTELVRSAWLTTVGRASSQSALAG